MEYSAVLWVAEQCEGLADGLRYLHRFASSPKVDSTSLVPFHHGNIKPENILVFCSPHRNPVLQLADFGNSTDTTEFNHNRLPKVVDHGAEDYTAPEVYFGEPGSSKSDVWSLCCVFLDFIEWVMPSRSAPGQPKRVLNEFEEKGMYVQGREAVRDWRRSRVGSGSVDVAGYFFDTSTGGLNIWIDTVSVRYSYMCECANIISYSGCTMLKTILCVQNGCVNLWAIWMNPFCNKKPVKGYQVELYTVV